MISQKNILIAGSTGGIGSYIAKEFSKCDVSLFLLYNDEDSKKILENDLDKLNCHFSFFKCDLNSEEQVNFVISGITEKAGIDIFIHCASSAINYDSILKKEWSCFETHLSVQLKSTHQIIRLITPYMIKQKLGKIVFVLTEYVFGRPPERISDYICAKYSLLGYSKCLASELGKYNINVNCISPGILKTNLSSKVPPKFFEIIESQTPLRRIASVKDVCDAIFFLISDNSSFVTGENILINGGYFMK